MCTCEHISATNGALWDICLMHCGICEMGLYGRHGVLRHLMLFAGVFVYALWIPVCICFLCYTQIFVEENPQQKLIITITKLLSKSKCGLVMCSRWIRHLKCKCIYILCIYVENKNWHRYFWKKKVCTLFNFPTSDRWSSAWDLWFEPTKRGKYLPLIWFDIKVSCYPSRYSNWTGNSIYTFF